MRGDANAATTQRQLALAFLQRFAAGDVAGIEALLAADARVTGPLLAVASRAEYLAALRADPPAPAEVRVLSVTESADAVAVFYEYVKPDSVLTIAQLCRFRDGLISEMRLVFDTRGSGAP